MGRYIDSDNVIARYKRMSDMGDNNEINDTFIQYAENFIDASLAVHYSVPFSNNNITVKDLCIDVAFAKTQLFKDQEKAEMIMTHVNSIIGALNDGKMIMVTSSGDALSVTGEPVYSENMEYYPTFQKDDIIYADVDSSQQWDIENDRDIV